MKRNHLLWALIALMNTFIACSKDDKPGRDEQARPPVIDGFTPSHTIPGAQVVIMGSNFSTRLADNEVSFNDVTATVTAATATELRVTVPANATTGRIKVKVKGKMTTSAFDFVVDPLLAEITDFTPKQGAYGTIVTITGNRFGANPIVRVNNKAIEIVSSTNTEIKVKTPSDFNLTAYKLVVEVGAQAMLTATEFQVTYAGPMAGWQNKNINAAPAAIFNGGVSFVYKNKLYWGFTKLTFGETKTEYMVCDPANPQWILQTALPAAIVPPELQNATAVVMQDKVYIGTGFTNAASAKWWQYDPETNTGVALPDLPVGTAFASSFVLNNTLYAGFGGSNKKLFKYNPAGNGNWDMAVEGDLRELNSAGAVVIGDDVYIGRALMDLQGTRQAMFKFTAPNHFTRVTNLPDEMPMLSTPSFVLNGKGYFIIDKRVWQYTPGANGGTWDLVLNEPNGPSITHVGVVNGVAYGWTGAGRLFEFKFQ